MKNICVLFSVLCVMLVAGCVYKNPSVRAKEMREPEPSEVAVTAPIEFRLGPGDEVTVSVWRQSDFDLESARIDETGQLMHPVLGDVPASGKTVRELRNALTEKCRHYLVDPRVSVTVTTMQSQKVIVLGEVNRPQVLTMTRPVSLIELISLCGGYTSQARETLVMVLRPGENGKPMLMSVDTVKLLASASLQRNIMMRPGDIVYVPSSIEADVDEFFSYLTNAMNAIRGIQTNITLWPDVRDIIETGDTKDVQRTTIGL